MFQIAKLISWERNEYIIIYTKEFLIEITGYQRHCPYKDITNWSSREIV